MHDRFDALGRLARLRRSGWARTPARILLCGLLAAMGSVPPSRADPGDPEDHETDAIPAEEVRLNRAAFRTGLKERGLTELLELHLRDFPPSGEAEGLLMQRDLRLAVFADAERTDGQRRSAIREANRILDQLIENHAYDPRRFEWHFELAHSLIYDEAEPYVTSILYRGGTPDERGELRKLTARALAVASSLNARLSKESERIEKLSVPRFEQLERTGYIEHIDGLVPRADYLLLWVMLYDSLARDDADRTRIARLHRIREHLAQNPAIVNTPHHESYIQVQALVLAGITERLLNDHVAARQYLERALTVAEGLVDGMERGRVDWAVTLATLERIRNDRDDGRFSDALGGLTRFRRQINRESGSNFGLQIVAALLERSVHRARAGAAEHAARHSEAKSYQEEGWQPLAQLVRRYPQRRDEIYATLTAINGYDTALAKLDPFDQCALIAGLLFEAGEAAGEADPLLARAVEIGEWFLDHVDGLAESLAPEVTYNVAVAQYRRGRMVEAARRFLDVARDHVTWENALQAAVNAVQLTADLYKDPALRDHPELQQLHRDTLGTLVALYGDSEAARYWRFYYAQLLDELGEYDSAAGQYALVHGGHEHHLEAVFARVRCLALRLQELAAASTPDRLALRKGSGDFFTLLREFLSQAGAELSRVSDPERTRAVTRLLARAKVIGAEIQVLGQVDRPRQTLEGLAEFEKTYPEEKDLVGRVWRVRLMAHERLGQLEEAARAIPAYVAAEPENAGPTLQSLYNAIAGDVEKARGSGDERAAQRKAEVALLLADQIMAWADRYGQRASPQDRRLLTVQLAQANLQAGRFGPARELFGQCLIPGEGSNLPDKPTDLHVMFGLAEAEYQVGEWESALPRFNALAVGLPANDPLRFKSLLRDLQCRTELNHRPRGILKVIEQQKYLFPDLGGPALAEEFKKLERKNLRRGDEE